MVWPTRPSHRDALVARGDSFYDDGQLAMALTDYRSALDVDLAKGENGDQARIRCSSVLCAMGTLEFEAQQHLKAEQIFSRAIEFNSRDPNLRVCRAWARVHLGSIEMELRAKSDALLALQVNVRPYPERARARYRKRERERERARRAVVVLVLHVGSATAEPPLNASPTSSEAPFKGGWIHRPNTF